MVQCVNHKRYNKKCDNCINLKALEELRNKNITSKTKIVISLRTLWLRSRERAAALKRDNYTCQTCKRKQSTAKGKEFKVQVHHKNGIEWETMIDSIRKHLLIHPDGLECICKEDHNAKHKNEVKRKSK